MMSILWWKIKFSCTNILILCAISWTICEVYCLLYVSYIVNFLRFTFSSLSGNCTFESIWTWKYSAILWHWNGNFFLSCYLVLPFLFLIWSIWSFIYCLPLLTPYCLASCLVHFYVQFDIFLFILLWNLCWKWKLPLQITSNVTYRSLCISNFLQYLQY